MADISPADPNGAPGPGAKALFDEFDVQLSEREAAEIVHSIGMLAGQTGQEVTLVVGRVCVHAVPDGRGVEVELGSLPSHPTVSRPD